MTVKYQISDKRGDAILLVSAEGPGAEQDAIYSAFAAAVQDAGLEASLNGFGTGLVQAVTTAQPLVQPQQPVQEPWGNPPVPPMQQAPIQQLAPQSPYQPPQQPAYGQQPQVPAAAAPSCHHGVQKLVQGEKNGRTWKAWGCPADRNDPSKCGLEFIRG